MEINQFPPFNVVELAHVSEGSPEVFDDFHTQFGQFIDMLRYDLVLSGEDIVPLFRTSKSRQESSQITGAALPALIIAMIALSPFWAPQVERLLPWGGKPPAAGQEYAAFAGRPTEIEKRPALSSFDVDAIKSAESALGRRVDQLEAALSRLQELPVAPPSNAPAAPPPASPGLSNEQPAAPVPPAAGPHLSTEEIAELLARGDTLLRRGDIASARLFYERAANAGDGRAALRMGATFDPAFLGRDVLRGVLGDTAEARLWYQRARDLGEAEAERRLKSFETK